MESKEAEVSEGLAVAIMAGGVGTRFWPVSTRSMPKQFLNLLGERSLLQQSYDRARLLVAPERILVLTNADFAELVRDQLPDIPPGNVVSEPMRRDTAAAVALGALLCRKWWGDPVMVVLTADHRISPVSEFTRVVLSAARAARGRPTLYTLGVTPTYPASGYGYLQRSQLVLDDMGVKHYSLASFREKPDTRTAQEYVSSGEYLWNSGMFVWQTSSILAELRLHLPQHVESLRAAVEAEGTAGWDEALRRAFAELPVVSIDFGVMEKAAEVRTIEAGFDWNDLGGWLALEEFLEDDGKGNRHRGRLKAMDAEKNLVFAQDEDELVALLGVHGLLVVRSQGRTLVADRSRAEDIKTLVHYLEEHGQGRDL